MKEIYKKLIIFQFKYWMWTIVDEPCYKKLSWLRQYSIFFTWHCLCVHYFEICVLFGFLQSQHIDIPLPFYRIRCSIFDTLKMAPCLLFNGCCRKCSAWGPRHLIRKLRITSHLLKKALMENFIFWAVRYPNQGCVP